MTDEMTAQGSLEATFRPRRTHKKSRNGCSRCKQRRKKCDEQQPSCSRCISRGHTCQYPEFRPRRTQAPVLDPPVPLPRLDDLWRQLQTLQPSPGATTPTFPDAVSTNSSVPHSISSLTFDPPLYPFAPSSIEEADYEAFVPDVNGLESAELDLLGHYLSHSARAIAYDVDDLYALQVGFPSLAFANKPLMSSLLALSAVCKCHDMMRNLHSENDWTNAEAQLRCLFELAGHHHRASLRQTRIDMADAKHLEYVLANAPLMVLYGSTSQSARVRIANAAAEQTTPSSAANLASEFPPGQSQWVSLIRAASLAHGGLVYAQPNTLECVESVASSPAMAPFMLTMPDESQLLAEDGPSPATKTLLFPIVTSTWQAALDDLRGKAQVLSSIDPILSSPNASSTQGAEISACTAALDVLAAVVLEVIQRDEAAPAVDISPSPRASSPMSSDVSPWLRSYLGRVTSAAPTPQPYRRIISSFVNRVPAEFLDIVQCTLDLIPEEDEWAGQPWWGGVVDSPEGDDPAQRLAMDIFAHWLVLVMLLDGVWWMRGIGDWELGRLVGWLRRKGWTGQRWWPESMFNIAQELKKQI